MSEDLATADPKPRRISSYSRTARRPLVGTLWVWEPDLPYAVELVRVADVRWNGEEWWVGTDHPRSVTAPGELRRLMWNDLSRFWEACHHVRQQAGPPGVRGATRAGAPEPDELRS